MQKIALVIASEKFRDEEYQIPKEIFQKNNFEVVTVSSKTGEVVGKLGLKAIAQKLISEISPADFAAIVFVGGPGSSEYFKNPVAHQLAKKAKILGAICAAPEILANAGILKGKKATIFPSSSGIEALKKGGATYTQKNVEEDGNIITADGPASAQEFVLKIIEKIKSDNNS